MNDKPETKTTVMMMRNYQPENGERMSKGSVVELPKALAAKLIKAGIASADAAV